MDIFTRMPKNHRPVGSERINKDGYIEIKVEDPRKWMPKHRVIWEKAYGKIPKNHMIIFADGNKKNLELDNLRMIGRGTNAVMNHGGLHKYTGELKDVAINIANLQIETAKSSRRHKSKP